MLGVDQFQSLLHITLQTKIASISRKSNHINQLPSHDLCSSSVAAFCASVLEEAKNADTQTTKKSIGAPRMAMASMVSIFTPY